jgi:uncharacterized protein (TIGR03435 family)
MVRTICFLLFTSGAVYCQSIDAAPNFEVASIKPSPPPDPGKPMYFGCRGGPSDKRDPVRWRCQSQTVYSLITSAYNLKRYQLTQPPNSFDSERYEIDATVPEGTTVEQFRQMQQNLLKERFKAAVHFEKKELPGYELVLAKGGLKMGQAEPPKPSSDDPQPAGPVLSSRNLNKAGFPIIPRGARGMIMMNGKASWGAGATMEEIATMLGTQLNRPVMDATGVSGKYEVALMWVPDNGPRVAAASSPGAEPVAPVTSDSDPGPTLPTAIQEQLGLKLQPKKMMVDVLIIDHVEKATDN